MSFESFHAFLEMGGHGPYVWGSYAAGAVLLALNLVRLAVTRRRTFEALRREFSIAGAEAAAAHTGEED
jgi:heme exporter protein D